MTGRGSCLDAFRPRDLVLNDNMTLRPKECGSVALQPSSAANSKGGTKATSEAQVYETSMSDITDVSQLDAIKGDTVKPYHPTSRSTKVMVYFVWSWIRESRSKLVPSCITWFRDCFASTLNSVSHQLYEVPYTKHFEPCPGFNKIS